MAENRNAATRNPNRRGFESKPSLSRWPVVALLTFFLCRFDLAWSRLGRRRRGLRWRLRLGSFSSRWRRLVALWRRQCGIFQPRRGDRAGRRVLVGLILILINSHLRPL